MKIIADTHTHTIVSGDAHSTLLENLQAAKARGLQFLCVTEHVSSIPRAAPPAYFKSMCSIPRSYDGVQIARGVEANILDYTGKLDMPDDILDWLDWVIASLHDLVIAPATKAEHTACWLAISENPLVDVIGHCGDPRYAFDLDEVMGAFHRHGKIVEINSHSFTGRAGSRDGCRQVALACMKYDVPIVVSSDAHFVDHVGYFKEALDMLEDIRFPEDLILNADARRFEACLRGKRTQP
ncbi:phosphatase [Pseudoflavonifractor phocaeensis]|uniref:phosphatase n=1 Tax=Pseudoflavonifractor phocaeensis TaxID=1870988 RepID=UPI001F3FF9A6|nr:phosphatase [Pseudoflavonifractor phocaeensis]MCF2662434.1 phosphatase [Pseudoflavonifractor phocaeensis]